MSGVRLRPAGLSDLDRVMEIEHASYGVDAWSRESMAGDLAAAHTVYLVAETGEGTVGYAGVRVSYPDAEVLTIAVDPAARGAGVGRALFDGLLAVAAEGDCLNVFLEVGVTNEPALALYRSRGFEGLAVRPRYYPSGEDALVMRLELKPRTPSFDGPDGPDGPAHTDGRSQTESSVHTDGPDGPGGSQE